jgi:hypothetical protein
MQVTEALSASQFENLQIQSVVGLMLLVVLGELVQTTAGKWITQPVDPLPERPERAHPRPR